MMNHLPVKNRIDKHMGYRTRKYRRLYDIASNWAATFDQQMSLLSGKVSGDILEVFAKNPAIVPDAQIILATHKNNDVRKSLAENPSLCDEARAILYNDPVEWIRWLVHYRFSFGERDKLALASELMLTDDEQIALAKDENTEVRLILSLNKSICYTAQMILAADSTRIVVRGLSHNTSIVPDAQMVIARSSYGNWRETLAGNISICHTAQTVLVKDCFLYVRIALAKNKAIAEDIRLILCNDKDQQVRQAARRRQ